MAQSPRESYLTLLERYEYNLALNSQWVLVIHGFPQVASEQISQLEAARPNDWLLSDAFSSLTKQQVQSTNEVGCFFVDSVSLPDERYGVETVGGYNFGGFARPGAAGARDAIASKYITTTFRETNLDFVDCVIRPWVVVGSYRGYFAYRDANLRIKTPRLQLISFSRQKHTPTAPYDENTFRPIRKVYNFYNCAPIGVDGKKYSYNEDQGTPEMRSVTWCFDNYGVNVSST